MDRATWTPNDAEILTHAIEKLKRCRVPEPGRIDEEIAELEGSNPDMAKARRVVGVAGAAS